MWFRHSGFGHLQCVHNPLCCYPYPQCQFVCRYNGTGVHKIIGAYLPEAVLFSRRGRSDRPWTHATRKPSAELKESVSVMLIVSYVDRHSVHMCANRIIFQALYWVFKGVRIMLVLRECTLGTSRAIFRSNDRSRATAHHHHWLLLERQHSLTIRYVLILFRIAQQSQHMYIISVLRIVTIGERKYV